MGLLTDKVGMSLTLLPSFEILFLLLGCVALPQYAGFCILFCCAWSVPLGFLLLSEEGVEEEWI